MQAVGPDDQIEPARRTAGESHIHTAGVRDECSRGRTPIFSATSTAAPRTSTGLPLERCPLARSTTVTSNPARPNRKPSVAPASPAPLTSTDLGTGNTYSVRSAQQPRRRPSSSAAFDRLLAWRSDIGCWRQRHHTHHRLSTRAQGPATFRACAADQTSRHNDIDLNGFLTRHRPAPPRRIRIKTADWSACYVGDVGKLPARPRRQQHRSAVRKHLCELGIPDHARTARHRFGPDGRSQRCSGGRTGRRSFTSSAGGSTGPSRRLTALRQPEAAATSSASRRT